MTSGRDKYSVREVERCSSTGSSKKQKRNKLLRGPLPFSFKQEGQKSSEPACLASPYDQDMKSDCESSFSSGSKMNRRCDTALKTYDEKGELAALNSVRDLMRRKRCLRTEQLDTVVKNIEMMDLCTEELIHHKSESEICTVVPQECPTIKSCSMAQASRVREKLSHSKPCIHPVHTDGGQSLHSDLCSPTNQMSSVSFLRNQAMQSNMPPYKKLHLQQESADGGCVGANNESQGFVQKSMSLFVENLNVDGLEFHKFNKQFADGPHEEKMGICKRNLTTINVQQPVMHDTKEHKNDLDNEITEHINSPLNRDLYTCNNLSKLTDTGYIEMTFSTRPPSRDELGDLSGDSAGIMAHAEDSVCINTGRQCEDDVLPFFSRNFEDGKSMKLLNDENLIFHQDSALGVPIHFQNDGSVLYLLTHAFLPPTLESVEQWLLEGMQGNHLNLSAGNACGEVSANAIDSHCLKPDLSSQASIEVMGAKNHDSRVDVSSTGKQGTSLHFKGNVINNDFHDLSQISGPYKEDKLGLTPLSQTGFRDPASIGGGQQLTVLSMEVLAESRGDLLPDPKVDAINVISLAIQEDSNHAIEVHILMRCNSDELFRRHVDGVSNCQFSSFNDEKLLLDHFVGMITSFDPDILMGWEIQGGSLGFLAERAAHLGVNLLKKISRVPSHETKFKASDLANPEPSNEQNMMLVSDTVPDVSIIEDEWGRTHASGIHVTGRIVLNIWRLMRAELNLNMYSVEAVAEEVLRRKIPSISSQVLKNWFLSGPGRARYRCIEYVIERAKLNLEIMNQLDMINRTSELARVFGIDFFSVLSRGSQFRVESMLLRLAHTQNYLAISPGNQQIFNARQLALKLIANVTYGYTAAGFSGRMPCAELADSIVQCGRRTLERAISFVNQHDKWKARVVYGDTDSMFVLLKGRSREEAFRIGNEIASAITSMNPDPVTLKMEKVYHPCFLLTKKRYVGYSYETPDQEKPIFDAKGTETVRRDTCPAVAKTLERSIRLFFEHQDISAIKTYLQRQWRRILSGKVSLQDFVFSKEVRLGTYSSRASTLPPAAIVATKAMQNDPRAEPRYGERIPYVVIHGEPGARLVDMVVSPYVLLDINSAYRLNELYYIKKQIIPALQRVFGLVGADLNQWFSDLPRLVRPTLAKRHNIVPRSESLNEIDSDIRSESSKMLPSKRRRIDAYYISKHCTLCAAVIGNTSKLEREIQHLVSICRHCGGGDWIIEGGVKCTSLACSVFYERRKIQKELQATSSLAAAAEFYPSFLIRCSFCI
ncbi:uncharacterized protein A4U43_C07F15260 [Asparagus officinalis]|uniref:DNA polymerase n=1 Tax=Asparagus officinalis TaxID=4686 RepID=A0A5P1EC59_ASPOF|nr:uncharacterized protein A4U43_C07F15260 [Asparagus officinalis]